MERDELEEEYNEIETGELEEEYNEKEVISIPSSKHLMYKKERKVFAYHVTQVCEAHYQVILSFHQKVQGQSTVTFITVLHSYTFSTVRGCQWFVDSPQTNKQPAAGAHRGSSSSHIGTECVVVWWHDGNRCVQLHFQKQNRGYPPQI